MLLLGSAGCTTTMTSAGAGGPTDLAAGPSTSTSTTTTTDTMPTDTMPTGAVPTTSTADVVTASTVPTPTTTSTPTESTQTETTPTVTAVPIPVGGFTCMPAGETPPSWEIRPPADIPAPQLPEGWTTAVIGRSVQGRAIDALVRPVADARRRVVVIGGVHGNEPATPPAVRGLVEATTGPDVEVWLVPEANPDGSAAGARCNANGVDLNRNFAWEWSAADGGPSPASEPETQALARLVDGLRPDVVVWVHQPLGYVSAIGGASAALEQAWADASGNVVRPDVTQHGGGESWSALVAGAPTVLVEIAGWEATVESVAAQQAGFEALLAALG